MRDDDRETTDLERFYQPLMEIFEHSRLLLLAYQVLYLRREKLEIDYEDFEQKVDAPVVCDSLMGRIITVNFVRRKTRSSKHLKLLHSGQVSLKYINSKFDSKNIEDYLMEEEAYYR